MLSSCGDADTDEGDATDAEATAATETVAATETGAVIPPLTFDAGLTSFTIVEPGVCDVELTDVADFVVLNGGVDEVV